MTQKFSLSLILISKWFEMTWNDLNKVQENFSISAAKGGSEHFSNSLRATAFSSTDRIKPIFDKTLHKFGLAELMKSHYLF